MDGGTGDFHKRLQCSFEMYFSGRNLERDQNKTIKGDAIDPQMAPWGVGVYRYSEWSDNGGKGDGKRGQVYFTVLPSAPSTSRSSRVMPTCSVLKPEAWLCTKLTRQRCGWQVADQRDTMGFGNWTCAIVTT